MFDFWVVEDYFIKKKNNNVYIYIRLNQRINTGLKNVKDLLKKNSDLGEIKFTHAFKGINQTRLYLNQHTLGVKSLQDYFQQIIISPRLATELHKFYCSLILVEQSKKNMV